MRQKDSALSRDDGPLTSHFTTQDIGVNDQSTNQSLNADLFDN